MTAPERETLTYEMFGQAVRELAGKIVQSGYDPEIILAIARGGLPLGGALSYALSVKNVSVINVEFYTGINQRLTLPVMLPPAPPAVDLSGAKVLIVNDVADTGQTLELVRGYCSDHIADVKTAVIYEKPSSVFKPDYVWKKTDQWINFPWSTLPPVRERESRVGH